MFKTIDLGKSDSNDDDKLDLIYQVMGLIDNVSCFIPHFKQLAGGKDIVELLENVCDLELINLDFHSDVSDFISEKVEKHFKTLEKEKDLYTMKQDQPVNAFYDQRWVSKKSQTPNVPFYYEGLLILEFQYNSCTLNALGDEILDEFGSNSIAESIRKAADLLEKTEDLFEDFLEKQGIDIMDHPYWNLRYPGLNEDDDN